ncbi:hypothetical protein BD626DRAFT_632859 [Schizophyllum amplum]|uniref:SMP domain-containing protein n=1 Tax=Schizophyllum amplum TaxID=97359 RepID=A0A550C5M2_9AGAR|nr:hypothetical protein BD626DRAFT_632859 [Auriculariopsis ampla]
MTTNEQKAIATEIAAADAAKIEAQRLVDLEKVTPEDAKKLMSEEHKALGYRPPAGSLAAEAQSKASKIAEPSAVPALDEETIRKAALSDAARIQLERGQPVPERSITGELDIDALSEADAKKLMSEEHKALGYRPPQNSLAAKAQAAAARHPQGNGTTVDARLLTEAAVRDAARISEERGTKSGSTSPDLSKLTPEQVSQLESQERKMLGSNAGTASAEAQSIQAKTAQAA